MARPPHATWYVHRVSLPPALQALTCRLGVPAPDSTSPQDVTISSEPSQAISSHLEPSLAISSSRPSANSLQVIGLEPTSPPTNKLSGTSHRGWTPLFRPLGHPWTPLFPHSSETVRSDFELCGVGPRSGRKFLNLNGILLKKSRFLGYWAVH